jgi:hypothetical protein
MNGMFQFLVFAADVNLLDENIILFRVVFWDILPCKMIVDRRFRGANL